MLELKERTGTKHKTIVGYKDMTSRVYPAIGHIKLKDLRVDHLNSFYTSLLKGGTRKGSERATAKVDLKALCKEKKLTFAKIAADTGIAVNSITLAAKDQRVNMKVAAAISAAVGLPLESAFSVEKDMRPLSAKTVLAHHKLISTVLEQAVKEGLVPFNVAARATLPKAEHKEVNYFQLDQVSAIRNALEGEPIKWRMLVHLLLITGARRGEILGLKWDKVNFETNKIRICNTINYVPDIGVYEDTPKTERSNRTIALPQEIMQMLRQYHMWQTEERMRLGGYFQYQGYVFSQDNGKPMHPDSVTDWLTKFSERHGLPHINPHAFRHTMASLLFFNGMDSVSISRRLGHAQVSTTADIYAHIIEEADQQSADILSDIFLKKA